ncbi:hypothetical protein TGPRC2_269470 [Toxoplasma gondii TgCatPRC2]|uniref:Uncharacterized protein n=1 Tax=Toxoplasma gondii TgCatPRC2 TaxID=1130821 RepID=A0A151HNR4_TOXGO|nr:hypothetical protein TGPRC2_269470 [Toxoplasma gondii TgCatPRC2]
MARVAGRAEPAECRENDAEEALARHAPPTLFLPHSASDTAVRSLKAKDEIFREKKTTRKSFEGVAGASASHIEAASAKLVATQENLEDSTESSGMSEDRNETEDLLVPALVFSAPHRHVLSSCILFPRFSRNEGTLNNHANTDATAETPAMLV